MEKFNYESIAEDAADTSEEQRAANLFKEQQQVVWRRTDRLFAGLMTFQWLAGIIFALVISPKTWEGASSQTHIHVWVAVFLGGIISGFPIALALFRPGWNITRYSIAIGQMLMSALLIHLTGGRIETHFHVFWTMRSNSFVG